MPQGSVLRGSHVPGDAAIVAIRGQGESSAHTKPRGEPIPRLRCGHWFGVCGPTVLPPFGRPRANLCAALPAKQPSCTLASLNPSCEEDDESARLALAKELRPGLWCSGREPWPLDHSASHLRVGSATTEFALRVVLPAMCRLAASE